MVQDLNGARFYLNAQQGKVTIVHFWSVYCIPCMQEMRFFEELSTSYPDSVLSIIGICTDPGETGLLDSYLAKAGITYRIAVDRTGEIWKQYGVEAVPATFLVSRGGLLRYRFVGYTPDMKDHYRTVVAGLIRDDT